MEGGLVGGRMGQACPFTAVPLARRQGLVGGSRHIGQHFSQVRAALGAADVRIDDFAPARAHGVADQLVHAMRCARALGVGDVIHRGGDVLDDHLVVERDANFQAVDRRLGGKRLLVGDLKIVGFHIGQFGFDVPQTVFTVKALVNNGSRM